MVNSEKKYTGRIVAVVSIVVGLIGALAPVVADMDLSSTAGIVAGLVAVSTVVVKYLDGWQKFEERLDAAGPTTVPSDEKPPAPPEEPPGPQPRVLVPVPDDDGDPEEELADVPSPPDDDEVDAITDELVLGDVLPDEEERRAA